MKRYGSLFGVLFALVLAGCGEHIQDPQMAVTIGPPQSLGAVSQTGSSVTLHWSAGIGDGDPTFLGYIVDYGGIEDSVPKTQLGYLAESLPPGATLFNVHSYQSDGPRTDPATILWAPADRFEINAIVVEYFLQAPGRISGFSMGSETRNPNSMAIEPIDTTVLGELDFYLYGSNGVVENPLSLYGAQLFRSDFRRTEFSTVSDSAANLNFPLGQFPDESTFVLDSVSVAENRLYYLRIRSDNGVDHLYGRIHVRISPGRIFPDRQVTINVSLQRTPGVPFADGDRRRSGLPTPPHPFRSNHLHTNSFC
ncbi:MAG: fibronectin type III domain-containing protein [Ignavibacteria bacterium]|nr:fibronectin type III domain-containing protein [Ignavibacteria bacterium]